MLNIKEIEQKLKEAVSTFNDVKGDADDLYDTVSGIETDLETV